MSGATAGSAKLLDRVTKLIALSSSSFEGEAKSAALRACELIREHGLAVASDQREETKPVPAPPVSIIRLSSKYRGFCQVCGSRYEKWTRIAWAKGHGAVYLRCYSGPWWKA